MPPNPSVTSFFTGHLNSPLEAPGPVGAGGGLDPPAPENAFPANWPGGPPPASIISPSTIQALSADDWGTVEAQLSKPKREIPSKDRCFYLIMGEREINACMSLGNAFGVEEAAILEGENKVVKSQQTMFIVKCVGRLEFTKPKFEELEDYDEAGPTTA